MEFRTMKRLILSVALFVAATTAPAAELKDLAGTYKVTAMHSGGAAVPADALKAFESFTIAGDKLTVQRAGTSKVATITKVDVAAKPAEFDLVYEDNKAATLLGAYSLDKNTLTLVLSHGSVRPNSLDGKGAIEVKFVLEKVGK